MRPFHTKDTDRGIVILEGINYDKRVKKSEIHSLTHNVRNLGLVTAKGLPKKCPSSGKLRNFVQIRCEGNL